MAAERTDVAIVGAGLAGLIAARQLTAAGLDVVVLEARNRTGGRILNAEVSGGTPVEVGAQWVGPGQQRIAALLSELGLQTFPTPDDGLNVAEINGQRHLIRGTNPPFSPLGLADALRAQVALDWMARRVPLDRPWTAARAAVWDAETFETWLRRNVLTRNARQLFRLFTTSVFGAEAENLSLLHVLWYLHSGGGFSSLANVSGGAQQDRVVGGTQRITDLLTEKLDARIRLSSPVHRIAQDGDGVELTTSAGPVTARRVIVAVPPALAVRISYNPAMPGPRDQLMQRMPHGAIIKTMSVYDEPFWREDGLSGQAYSDAGPAKMAFDNTPPSGSPGILVAFLEGRHAVRLSAADAATRRRVVTSCLARYFGPRAADPIEYVERDWLAEEWTRGCYGGHMPPGVWTQYGPTLRRPVGRIHWAGTETAEVWAGYMDGAIESGQRAAAEVLDALNR